VEDECSNYGKVLHVSVDTASPEVDNGRATFFFL
jgi:hypothetical protein